MPLGRHTKTRQRCYSLYNTLISPPRRGGFAMVSHLFFYQLVLIALVWLCLMLHWAWPSDRAIAQPTPPQPAPPRHARGTGGDSAGDCLFGRGLGHSGYGAGVRG